MTRILTVAFLCTALFAVSYTEEDDTFVPMVRQKYLPEINKELNSQITKELQASYVYQAYASYFQRADVALHGIHKFFAAASLEEREHAQKLIDYINMRGGHVKLENIQLSSACTAIKNHSTRSKSLTGTVAEDKRMCICNFVLIKPDSSMSTECGDDDRDEWKNGLYGFEDALITERFVNQKLLDLHKKAEDNNDAHLSHLLEHDFLEEQVESIYQLATYVTRLNSFKNNYKLGEYLFDQKLQ